MKEEARSVLDAVLRRSPAQVWSARRNRAAVRILTYHVVGDSEQFGRQLDLIVDRCVPLSLEQVLAAIRERNPLPAGATLITFDDGDRSLIDVAMPELVTRNIPAVAFVVAGVVDSKTPFWWVEVEELYASGGRAERLPNGSAAALVAAMKKVPNDERLVALERLRTTAKEQAVLVEQLTSSDLRTLEANGIRIENHSMTHPCLNRCTEQEIIDEIELSTERLTHLLGRRPTVFAYPNGDVDDRVVSALRDAGYVASFLFDHRLTELPIADHLRISRVRASGRASLDRLATILSGLHPAIHHRFGRP